MNTQLRESLFCELGHISYQNCSDDLSAIDLNIVDAPIQSSCADGRKKPPQALPLGLKRKRCNELDGRYHESPFRHNNVYTSEKGDYDHSLVKKRSIDSTYNGNNRIPSKIEHEDECNNHCLAATCLRSKINPVPLPEPILTCNVPSSPGTPQPQEELRTLTTPTWTNTADNRSYSTTKLSNLPEELFYKMRSYIGPASNSLIHFSQVNKQFYDLLQNKIGLIMINGTKNQFRSLLPKLSFNESNLCWFVRHVQCCWDIRQRLIYLKTILDKDFCIFLDCRVNRNQATTNHRSPSSSPHADMIVTSSSTPPSASCPSKINTGSYDAISPEEVDISLDLALSLMKGDPMKGEIGKDGLGINAFLKSYSFGSPLVATKPTFPIKSKDKSIIQYCSESLENLVLILCGKCGGKAFKFAKMRLWLRNEVGLEFVSDVKECINIKRSRGETYLISDASISGGMQQENVSHEEICNMAKAKDEDRMNKARLLMQLVISRELELSRQRQRHNMQRSSHADDSDISVVDPARGKAVGSSLQSKTPP